MTYDEFSDMLCKIKRLYKEAKNEDLVTVDQLDEFLLVRLLKKRSNGAKTLKGIL